MAHKNPLLTERVLILKCQHCRFQACIDAGMKQEYVQGSIAFGDNRTSRKPRSGDHEHEGGSALVQDDRGRDQPMNQAWSTSVPAVSALLNSSTHHLMELVSTFWGRYCYEQSNSAAAETWIAPDSAISKLQCVDHIKDALQLHAYRLTELLDMLPYTRFMFTLQQKSMIIMKCYIEVIVLRWVMTTSSCGKSIRGVTGIAYQTEDIWYVSFMANWVQFRLLVVS